MEEETKTIDAKYLVACYSCSEQFDAMKADWCFCINSHRSLVCPNCLKCFCVAPLSYKAHFWSLAPSKLWEKKNNEAKKEFIPVSPPDPLVVKRPVVLIADDEKDIRKIASIAVESLGYSVILAQDGEEALKMAKIYKPELIIADVLMPKINGRELCKRVKEELSSLKITVILMTTIYRKEQYRSEAIQKFRVDEYLLKPIDLNKLKTVLQRYLTKR